MDYRLTWVLGRFAGNPAECRQAFHDAAGEYNAAHGMPRGELLAPVSFTVIPAHKRATADSNIRMCRYFVLAAEDSWDAPPASCRHDYNVALSCRADPDLPLQEMVAMFRKPSEDEESDRRLGAFRKAFDPGVRQFDFSDAAEFKAQVAGLFAAWMESSA